MAIKQKTSTFAKGKKTNKREQTTYQFTPFMPSYTLSL